MKAKSAPQANQSTEKALSIIELLSASHSPMRLQDISAALGMNASTALRFLNSLCKANYIDQDPNTQRYFMTYKLCYLSNRILSNMDLPTITHPYLVELCNAVRETVCISVEQAHAMVYVDIAADHSQSLMSVQRLGNRSPMHCTGNGKIILLNYTPQQLDELIAEQGLKAYTKNTITTKEQLMIELSRTQMNGYAIDNEECEPGMRCIACPIRNYTGSIIAGISITGPANRMTNERIPTILPLLQNTADEISKRLGFQ